jgi:hypothetical protein
MRKWILIAALLTSTSAFATELPQCDGMGESLSRGMSAANSAGLDFDVWTKRVGVKGEDQARRHLEDGKSVLRRLIASEQELIDLLHGLDNAGCFPDNLRDKFHAKADEIQKAVDGYTDLLAEIEAGLREADVAPKSNTTTPSSSASRLRKPR